MLKVISSRVIQLVSWVSFFLFHHSLFFKLRSKRILVLCNFLFQVLIFFFFNFMQQKLSYASLLSKTPLKVFALYIIFKACILLFWVYITPFLTHFLFPLLLLLTHVSKDPNIYAIIWPRSCLSSWKKIPLVITLLGWTYRDTETPEIDKVKSFIRAEASQDKEA